MRIKNHFIVLLLVLNVVFVVLGDFAYSQERFNEDLLRGFTYRNLGPFRTSAWIADIAVPTIPQEDHLYTFYVAARCGGLWKTTNNGTTFDPIFDSQSISAIGDVTLAPSNPNIVWVGTGGSENSRSAYSGDGVYKSTDGGKTWENVGLKDSYHIARIVIHPTSPDIVYVAAIGHLFSFNKQRGLFKTEDGGKTWEKVIYINEKVGVIDVVMDPSNPDILYAATYQMQRLPWHFERGGPGSAIYKTIDAGKTWTKLSGGLPSGNVGRIGLDLCLSKPNVVYALVENINKRPPTIDEIRQDRNRGLEPQQRGVGGEVYRSEDRGKTWKKMNDSTKDDICGKAAYSFGQIRIDPKDDKTVYALGFTLFRSKDGGITWNKNLQHGAFGDNRSMWIDPQNSNRLILGNDGGVHITYDGVQTWDSYRNIPIGEIYAIGVDMADPYNVYCGLQDHEMWKGPSNGFSGSITLADWVTVGTGDGMYNQVDPENSRWLYTTSAHGKHFRVDQKLGTRTSILPVRENTKSPYRFAWCAPVHISPHNSQIIYAGAQVLLRSMKRGDNWYEISPDLTTNDPIKIAGEGNIQYCCITTISESPVTPGIIWAGTDDGKVWLTRDHGTNWIDLTRRIARAGGSENRYVSRVVASNYREGTAYVAKSGYRRDDFKPYVFKTTDFGATWESIANNLPDKPINVIFEDKTNPNLLFLGNDIGVYISINGGRRWVSMRNNMPAIMVHDLLVHPRENDLVVGTYGRGLYITDVTALQEMNEKILAEDIHLFKVEPKVQRIRGGWGWYRLFGSRRLVTPNEANALVINYYLKNKVSEKVTIAITDPYGKEMARLRGSASSGMNVVSWDMQRRLTKEEEQAYMNARSRDREPTSRMVPPGEYLVVLEVGDRRFIQKALIKKRAGWPIGSAESSHDH